MNRRRSSGAAAARRRRRAAPGAAAPASGVGARGAAAQSAAAAWNVPGADDARAADEKPRSGSGACDRYAATPGPAPAERLTCWSDAASTAAPPAGATPTPRPHLQDDDTRRHACARSGAPSHHRSGRHRDAGAGDRDACPVPRSRSPAGLTRFRSRSTTRRACRS